MMEKSVLYLNIVYTADKGGNSNVKTNKQNPTKTYTPCMLKLDFKILQIKTIFESYHLGNGAGSLQHLILCNFYLVLHCQQSYRRNNILMILEVISFIKMAPVFIKRGLVASCDFQSQPTRSKHADAYQLRGHR